jgi:thiol-disulfide isomerase/thioredoxin
MGITVNNLSTLNNLINIDHGDKVVFFKFGTDWCIPCVELDKILVIIPNSIVYHISADNENFESYLIENKIYTFPFTLIKVGKKIKKVIGLHTFDNIVEYIEDLQTE